MNYLSRNWRTDLDVLKDRNWVSNTTYVVLIGASNLNDFEYDKWFRNSKTLLMEHGAAVSSHAEFDNLVSLLAFAGILDAGGFPDEQKELVGKLAQEVEWIKTAFEDEENPFPFRIVGEIQKKHKQTMDNIVVLDRFLKGLS